VLLGRDLPRRLFAREVEDPGAVGPGPVSQLARYVVVPDVLVRLEAVGVVDASVRQRRHGDGGDLAEDLVLEEPVLALAPRRLGPTLLERFGPLADLGR
jgi:hypothetical protein